MSEKKRGKMVDLLRWPVGAVCGLAILSLYPPAAEWGASLATQIVAWFLNVMILIAVAIVGLYALHPKLSVTPTESFDPEHLSTATDAMMVTTMALCLYATGYFWAAVTATTLMIANAVVIILFRRKNAKQAAAGAA